MARVYFITVDELRAQEAENSIFLPGDMYYVMAENEEDAIEHLRERIRKYYFKALLSNKASDCPKRLGDRIIVEQHVTEEMASAPMDAMDVTAMAYLWKEDSKPHFEDWDITLEDASA